MINWLIYFYCIIIESRYYINLFLIHCTKKIKYANFLYHPLQAVFKQDCQSCRLSFFPYKIEGIKCRYCQETSEFCQCERDDHHVDPSKPHRSDLCGKCKAGYPCDYTTALTDGTYRHSPPSSFLIISTVLLPGNT